MKSPTIPLQRLWLFSSTLLVGSLIVLNLIQSTMMSSRPPAVPTPLPHATAPRPMALTGEAALEHLKQQGLYASLRETLESRRYDLRAAPGAWRAGNPAQEMNAYFTAESVRVLPRDAAQPRWETELRLKSYGYGTRLHAVGAGAMHTKANRIEIHKASLTEWYVNRPTGIEQGFTLAAAPDGKIANEPLQLKLEVTGALRTVLAADGQAVDFVGAQGQPMLRYDKLVAWDADKKLLDTRMAVAGSEISLVIDDANAVYPVTIDPLLTQQTQLTATDGAAGDFFGVSVAIDGDTVVVGAPNDDVGANANQGAAYVFVRTGNTWVPQGAVLTANDGAANDQFGNTVAIKGETVVVGAPQDDVGANLDQGSAYVFVRQGNLWAQQGTALMASDGAADDRFGTRVAIDGETMVVGAPRDDVGTNINQGSVWVFVRSGAMWTPQQQLFASDSVANANFGFAASLEGETLVVGAPTTRVGTNSGQGAAYIFTRSGGLWTPQQQLLASDGEANDNFGFSTDINGETLLVGAPADNIGANLDQGSVRVFTRAGVIWTQQGAVLTANDGAANDRFGIKVGVSGETLVAGAWSHDVGMNVDQGAAYIFTRSSANWTQQGTALTADTGAAGDNFGLSVAISGVTVVIGSPLSEVGTNPDQGAAYIFAPACTAPSITEQPVSSLVCCGNAATFSVTATGSNLTYQWRKSGVNLIDGDNISGATSPALTIHPTLSNDAGSYDVIIADGCGNTVISGGASLTILHPPTANAGGPYTMNEGGALVVMASGTDPENGALSYAWDLDADGSFETPGQSVSFSAVGLDGPSSRIIKVRVTDSGGLSAIAQATVSVLNVAPSVGAITASTDPQQIGNAIVVNASFTDAGTPDTHTATWYWDDGTFVSGVLVEATGSGTVSGSRTFIAPGVYALKLRVTDDDGDFNEALFQYVVVYDPQGGFVTGGGWIDSPAGAYLPDATLFGKANFGFVSKYQKGATVPIGNTEFHFKAGNFNFHSTVYDWLVVAGHKAQYKGAGKVNGAGDYAFLLTATDGQQPGGGGVDKFRIKIWDKATGQVVYDNKRGTSDDLDNADPQTISGGSIVIHKGDK